MKKCNHLIGCNLGLIQNQAILVYEDSGVEPTEKFDYCPLCGKMLKVLVPKNKTKRKKKVESHSDLMGWFNLIRKMK